MPPRKKKPTGPTPVDAITHGDKRTNILTADAHDLVTPEHEKTETVVYPRDLRAPMLVWQGKEALDETDLEADAPPVYIQEKIDPRVLVRSEEHTSELQSLMRISYAVFCLKKKNKNPSNIHKIKETDHTHI